MRVADADAGDGCRERVAVELGVAPRPGDGPHVDHCRDAVGMQEAHEAFKAPRRVADGQDAKGHEMPGGPRSLATSSVRRMAACACREKAMSFIQGTLSGAPPSRRGAS